MDKGEFYEKLKRAFTKEKYFVRFHAHLRMRERGISEEEVLEVILTGEVIEYYHDAKPYPACLIFKSVKGKPIHVVCALSLEEIGFLVTAYIPSLDEWESDYRRRKKK